MVRRLVDWFSPRPLPRSVAAPALRILRLERRRVLSADFSLGASGMMLSGFDSGGETLSISQLESEYRFTLGSGDWTPMEQPMEGVHVDGQTLMLDAAMVDQIVGGLTVASNQNTPLDVEFGQADLSMLGGPVQLVGVRSVSQAAGTQLALGSNQLNLAAAPDAGITVTSLNVVGDLQVFAFGPIVDGAGTKITVTGDATFISRTFSPEADFDGSGLVDGADYDVWKSNFGVSGALKSQGDANGDGFVDAADYTVWRDTLGQTSQPGGITLANNPADLLSVGGHATFDASDGADRFNISVGQGGRAYFGSLTVIGGDAQVREASSTVLDSIDAVNFTIDTTGSITDSAGAQILISQDATLRTAAPLLEADFDGNGVVDQADRDIYDTFVGASGATHAQGDANGDGAVNAFDMCILDATFGDTLGDASIDLADAEGNVFSVGSLALLRAGAGAPYSDVSVGDAGTANFGSLNLTGSTVVVYEDSASNLTSVIATTFELHSGGGVTDSSNISIAGDALFVAAGPIVMNENPGDILSVGGQATFLAAGNNITLGSAGMANFGQIRFVGASVTVQEDSGTELFGVSTADTLAVTSTGAVTDAAGASLAVTNDLALNAGGAITLSDNAADSLGVGGVAFFNTPGQAISVGPAGLANFGSLRFVGAAVTVQEDSGTQLTGASTAASLSLGSAGGVTDAGGTSVTVTGAGTINAGGAILLADQAGESLSVGGQAFLNAPGQAITVGPAGLANFGQVRFAGAATLIQEDSATELWGVSSAASLGLTSAGAMTTAAGAQLSVAGNATFTAAGAISDGAGTSITVGQAGVFNATGPITLNDTATDTLTIGTLATFSSPGQDISIGALGAANFGQLAANGAAVVVQEDSDTVLTTITANSFSITSAGSITDASMISIAGDGTFNSAGAITLNDQAGDVLSVGGTAFFNAAGQSITIGSAGAANFGSLRFVGAGVTIQEDSATGLVGASTAASLALSSAGAVTDAAAATLNVTGGATINAGGPITLSDEAANTLAVGGLAFLNAPGQAIMIGPAGTTNFGTLRFVGAGVSVQEVSATEFAGVSTADSLSLTSAGAITDAAGASITVVGGAGLTAGGVILLSDAADNTLSVGALASFSAAGQNITIGPAGTSNFGQLAATGAVVMIQEDSDTVLTTISADNFTITSSGSITDASMINVAGDATFNAAGPITLNDTAGDVLSVGGVAFFNAPGQAIAVGPAGTANFGSLRFVGAGAVIQEDSATNLSGASSATSLTLSSAGAVTDAAAASLAVTGDATINAGGAITLADAVGNTLSVGGLAFLNAPGQAISVGPAGVANFGGLRFVGTAVSIQEDSSTELRGVSTADVLTLTSAGAISDAAMTSVSVGGDATLNAAAAITLNDTAGDVLSVGGLAFFNTSPASDIAIGPLGAANFGSLRFVGAAVTIQEDSATQLAGASTAASLSLSSTGAVTDAAAASLVVSGMGTINAGGPITLSDQADNTLTVGGRAFFNAPGQAIMIGPAGAANFGQLRFVGAGVSIQEDSATELWGASTASTLGLVSAGAVTTEAATSLTVTTDAMITAAGSISDGAGTVINIGGVATLSAGGPITLSDSAGDVLSVGGQASFLTAPSSAITLGSLGTTNFGSLRFVGAAVSVQEDSSTQLFGVSSASTLALTSTGGVTDASGVSLTVTGAATINAAGEIVLNDQPADILSVGGLAFFNAPAFDITIGSAGAANFGQLRLFGASVTVQEDSGTEFAGASEVGTLSLQTTGNITDAPTATLRVNGASTMIATGAITLADAGATNSLIVVGHGSFTVGAGQNIDIGVVPATGAPAAANAQLGSLNFVAPSGQVRIALDGPIILGALGGGPLASLADTGELTALGGGVTDNPNASTTLNVSGELAAATGSDIILGDAGATFSMGTDGGPAPFDADRFLALAASNVSIEADTSVNLRTGPADPAFVGTFFFTASGTVSQIGDAEAGSPMANAAPLTASRVAINSVNGAVLLTQVRLTDSAPGDTAPNLSLSGGKAEAFGSVLAANFDNALIPLAANIDTPLESPFFPIQIVPSPGAVPVDPSGVTPLDGVRVLSPSRFADAGTPQGDADRAAYQYTDAYTVVAVVVGDARVGVVHDATGVQEYRIGIEVRDDGNAYIQTTASDDPSAAGDLVFTAKGLESADVALADRDAPVATLIGAGAMTALAAGTLKIDTEDPANAIAVGARTTRLQSSTGTVTSVRPGTAGAVGEGPLMVVDAPTELQNAATTGLIVGTNGIASNQPFEQRVTLVAGSRDEGNLFVELETPDVQDKQLGGPDLSPGLEGTIPYADVTRVSESVQDPATQQLRDNPAMSPLFPALAFSNVAGNPRAVTVVHVYDQAFFPNNPDVNLLPTTFRLYNDPNINLFDGVNPAAVDGATDLNFVESSVTPRVISAQTGGYYEFSAPEQPTLFVPTQPPPVAATVTTPQPRTVADESRGTVSASVETILYGRVEGDEWANSLPGEEWPVQWDGETEGDFLEKIREKIDDGPAPEGKYRIVTKTTRGEQPLDEWVKGAPADDAVQQPTDEAGGAQEAIPAPPALPAEPPQAADGAAMPDDAAAASQASAAYEDAFEAYYAEAPADRRGASVGAGQALASTSALTAAVALARWNTLIAGDGSAGEQAKSEGFSRADRRRRSRARLQWTAGRGEDRPGQPR
ncbi:beta strand repeat-containing protein [Pirellulimonas nuda]|nr:hypothetical protein [Pirellulimonas nuda]